MLVPVVDIGLGQVFRSNDQQVLGVLLLSPLCKIEGPSYNCLPINDHNLVVGNGVGRIKVGIPILARKAAEVYLTDFWLLSNMACTLTPRLWALMRALAIGTEVKEKAWTRISILAWLIWLIMASVQPPRGLK
jgi:hypothetical protein